MGKDYTKAWILEGVIHWEAISENQLQELSTFYMVAVKTLPKTTSKEYDGLKKIF